MASARAWSPLRGRRRPRNSHDGYGETRKGSRSSLAVACLSECSRRALWTRCSSVASTARVYDGSGGDPNARALTRPGQFDVVDSSIARTSSLSLGIAALVLWAVSWSWLIGISTTVVRIGEVGALVVGLAAVAVGLTIRPRPAGLLLGVIALALVLGLNLLGLVLY